MKDERLVSKRKVKLIFRGASLMTWPYWARPGPHPYFTTDLHYCFPQMYYHTEFGRSVSKIVGIRVENQGHTQGGTGVLAPMAAW